MKVLNIIFIIYFIICAILQYNDPDPYLWIPIYLYAAFLCYQAIQKKYNPILYITSLIAFGIYAVILFFDSTGVLSWKQEHGAESLVQSMKATKPWIEETREFLGLVIVIIVLLLNMWWLKKARRSVV